MLALPSKLWWVVSYNLQGEGVISFLNVVPDFLRHRSSLDIFMGTFNVDILCVELYLRFGKTRDENDGDFQVESCWGDGGELNVDSYVLPVF